MVDVVPSFDEAVCLYAKHLAAESWCVDVSGIRPAALHADSNRAACAEYFKIEFADWCDANGLSIASFDSNVVSRSLVDKVMARLPRIFGSSFRPTSEKFFKSRGALLANTYKPVDVPAPADLTTPAILQGYLERVLPQKEDRNRVLQFLAHIIQMPQVRPQFGLIMTGEGGTGKSFLVRLVEAALGNRYCWRENSYKPVFKQFSEVLPNNLLVTFDDASASAHTYEDLKHAITSEYQEVEVKGQQKTVSREVYARIIVLSNLEKPLRLVDDRRFYVPEPCVHKVSREESIDFFKEFHAWFKLPGTPAFLYHWFKSIDLTGFDPSATVQTAAHARMQGESDSNLEHHILSFVEQASIFHEAQLVAFLARKGVRSPDLKQLAILLEKAGYKQRRRPHLSGKGQMWLWCPASQRRSRSLTEEEVKSITAVLV